MTDTILTQKKLLLTHVLLRLIGGAQRAGVQLKFRVIYIYMSAGMSVVSKMHRQNYVAHVHAQSHFGAVKTNL